MRCIADIIKDDRDGKELSQTERQIAVAYVQGKYDAVMELKLDSSAKILALLDKTYNDFCRCDGGESCLKIDGKEYYTDAAYAIDGVNIFMKVFKKRLGKSVEVGKWNE